MKNLQCTIAAHGSMAEMFQVFLVVRPEKDAMGTVPMTVVCHCNGTPHCHIEVQILVKTSVQYNLQGRARYFGTVQ